MTRPYILVAGVGNIFLGDDAFGSEVARRLVGRMPPDEVRVADFGVRGFDLACALMDGYEVTVLVDATPRGGAPGTLYVIEPDLSELDASNSQEMMINTHRHESDEGARSGQGDGRGVQADSAGRMRAGDARRRRGANGFK